MKKIMIYAYTAHNFGDDLFIYILCKRYPETEFILYAPAIYEQTFKQISNLTIIRSDSFAQKIKRQLLKPFEKTYQTREKIAQTCDAAVYIGGSLFMERTKWKSDLQNINSMMRGKTPFFIIGANFGPFKSEHFYRIYEAIFSACTDVCFRDHYSYTLFSHLQQVRYASDLVYQLPLLTKGVEENYIVISVIDPAIHETLRHKQTSYIKAVSKIIKTYIEAGYKILLTGFCKQENDDFIIKQVIKQIPRSLLKAVTIHIYEGNLEQTIQLLSGAKAIIATRFHAMILGFSLHKPTFPIIYSEKMTNVLRDMNFTGSSWQLENIEEINVQDLLDFEKNIHKKIATEKQLAHDQFLALDQFLNE